MNIELRFLGAFPNQHALALLVDFQHVLGGFLSWPTENLHEDGMVYNLTIYEVAYRALRRSTAVASAAWSRIDCRIQRTNLTLRWVARRACRTRVDRSWPAAAHFWAAASVRWVRRWSSAWLVTPCSVSSICS